MTIGAFRPKRHNDLGAVAAKHADDVAEESRANRVDFFDSFERSIGVVENFEKAHPELRGGLAELETANISQLAEIAGHPAVPEPGAAPGHGDQADGCALGAIAGDGRGTPEALVVGVRHHHHQALAVAGHVRTIMNGCPTKRLPASRPGWPSLERAPRASHGPVPHRAADYGLHWRLGSGDVLSETAIQRQLPRHARPDRSAIYHSGPRGGADVRQWAASPRQPSLALWRPAGDRAPDRDEL